MSAYKAEKKVETKPKKSANTDVAQSKATNTEIAAQTASNNGRATPATELPEKKTPVIDKAPIQHSYSNTDSVSQDEENAEEYIIDDGSYIASPQDQRRLMKEAQKQKDNDANKKVAKTAVQGVATYFGGSAGNAIAGAVNNSGIADPIYDRLANQMAKQNRRSIGGKILQNKINKLDDEGVIDVASDVVDALGSKGSGAASKQAGNAAAKQAGSEAAKKAGSDAGSNLTKNLTSKSKTSSPNAQDTQNKKTSGTTSNADKKKIMLLIKTHPWLFLTVGIIAFLFLIIFLILLGAAKPEEDESQGYLDAAYDFTETMVTLTNSYTNESDKIVIDRLTLKELVLGAVYSEFGDELDGLTKEQKLEVYKTYSVVAKTIALSLGKYDSSTKEITIKSGHDGLPYCDIKEGCKIFINNGKYTYVPANHTGNLPGEVVNTVDPMPSQDRDILYQAYEATKYELVVPNSVNDAITTVDFTFTNYNQTMKEQWISSAKDGDTYQEIIKDTYADDNYKLYDIEDYAYYYNYADGTSYWWPIGSTSATGGIYSGTPSTTYISSKYGPRVVEGVSGFHSGIDIAGSLNQHVIIATRPGTVTYAGDGCPSVGSYGNRCGGGYGNYVMIDHGDGTASVYAHMYNGSIAVKNGDKVKQGQKLGMMGSSGSSTGSHLHFEIRINGERVDPLQYINAENPRPSASVGEGYEEGSSNMQSVCLSLKKSGFSTNAVAAIMVNINAESGFRTTALGDNGTSYGLCQWHNGRYSNLKSYCGSEYSTVKCQLSFLIHELQGSYKGVYNYLLTNNSAWSMAEYYCLHFEVPYNRTVTCPNRADRFANTYLNYVQNGCN